MSNRHLPAVLAAASLALGLCAHSAWAGPIPNVSYTTDPTFAGTYNPATTDNNVISHNVCDSDPGTPTSACSLVGAGNFQDHWTLTLSAAGVLTLTGTATTLNPLFGFDLFQGQVLDASNTVVANFFPLSPNPVSLAAGNYKINVDWSLSPAFVASTANPSALYSINVTTAPETLRTPEPATLALLGIALAGVGFIRRRS